MFRHERAQRRRATRVFAARLRRSSVVRSRETSRAAPTKLRDALRRATSSSDRVRESLRKRRAEPRRRRSLRTRSTHFRAIGVRHVTTLLVLIAVRRVVADTTVNAEDAKHAEKKIPREEGFNSACSALIVVSGRQRRCCACRHAAGEWPTGFLNARLNDASDS
jgi:hypothetical protein